MIHSARSGGTQRGIWVLWISDYPARTYGTEWRHYTSPDLVTWTDQGVSIPKYTVPHGAITDGDVWTGSTVVDGSNSAGHGQNAIMALVTMPNDGASGQDQSTALWYSTDGGKSFLELMSFTVYRFSWSTDLITIAALAAFSALSTSPTLHRNLLLIPRGCSN